MNLFSVISNGTGICTLCRTGTLLWSVWGEMDLYTRRERVHLTASYSSHHLFPGYLIVWRLLFSGEMGHVGLNLLTVRKEINTGFSFPNELRALLGTVFFWFEPTLDATSSFCTSCFNLFLVSHHLLLPLSPLGIRALYTCCPRAVHLPLVAIPSLSDITAHPSLLQRPNLCPCPPTFPAHETKWCWKGKLISRVSAVTLKLLCKSITTAPAPHFEREMAATDSKCYVRTTSM